MKAEKMRDKCEIELSSLLRIWVTEWRLWYVFSESKEDTFCKILKHASTLWMVYLKLALLGQEGGG